MSSQRLLKFTFHVEPPPVFDSEYYRRRWTIRFCILGLLMLQLVSSTIISLNIMVHKKFFSVKLLVTIAPFFLHSLQLFAAIVILRSQRTGLKMLNMIATWHRTSNFILPTIFLEIIILLKWEFNWTLICLTIAPYTIAITKMNHLMNQIILNLHHIDVMPLRRESQPPLSPPITTIDSTKLIAASDEIDIETDYLPTYTEATTIVNSMDPPDYKDLPPKYSVLMQADMGLGYLH